MITFLDGIRAGLSPQMALDEGGRNIAGDLTNEVLAELIERDVDVFYIEQAFDLDRGYIRSRMQEIGILSVRREKEPPKVRESVKKKISRLSGEEIKAQVDQLIILFKKGLSVRESAKELGRTETYIRTFMHNHGLRRSDYPMKSQRITFSITKKKVTLEPKPVKKEAEIIEKPEEGKAMKNTLGDLNNHLFMALERLNDKELKGQELADEIHKSDAITGVAQQIISNASLVLKAIAKKDDFTDAEAKLPQMLEAKGD